MLVKFARKFSKKYATLFSAPIQDVIREFVEHLEAKGFAGLHGRNKSSDKVPPNSKDRDAKVQYARDNNLWHYHIGIPEYRLSTRGDYTSEFVLHYQKETNEVWIIDYRKHPPMNLPGKKYLKR